MRSMAATPDDNEECDQATELVPLEERMHEASREQFVPPEVTTEEGDGHDGHRRDIADGGLVLGIGSLAVTVKGSKGSAEESPLSDLRPNYEIPPPALQGHEGRPVQVKQVPEEDVYRENKELKEEVDSLQGSNEALHKEVRDLRAREQALSNRSSDLHQKEQEQKLHFEKEKQELQLEKERHELQLEKERHALQLEREKEKFRVEKRESDLQFQQRELDIDSKALGLREEKLQIAKQEHEQSVKKQEEELKAKERNIRAESLQLKNQQKQNEVYFRKREEDLQFRERNLHLTERNLEVMIQENKVLKERMKNLKSENSKLREEVDRLNDQIAVLLPDETQPNGEPLLMSEDTADVDLPTVEASSSYSNGVPWPMSVEEEGEGRVLVPQVNHIPMQRASLEQSNHRRSWWQEYVVLNRLGGGTYGVVYHVRHRVDGVEYAMKIIRVPSSGHGEEMDKKLREVHALAKLDHPRIVRYYHSRVEELPAEWLEKGVKLNSTDQKAGPLTCLFIQTELCRGTFRGWLEDTEKTKKRERITVLKNIQQIQEAVLYIHQEGYIHRDLKPSNIFFSLKDGSIKVGDFGLVTQSETECEATGSTTPKHTGNAGTIFYRAPEQMSSGQTYDQKVDIFAIGVILFESNMFFQNENEYCEGLMALKENRLEKILPQFVQRLPCEAALIDLLTSYDPSERPTVEEVFQSQQWKDFQKNTGDPTNVPELDP